MVHYGGLCGTVRRVYRGLCGSPGLTSPLLLSKERAQQVMQCVAQVQLTINDIMQQPVKAKEVRQCNFYVKQIFSFFLRLKYVFLLEQTPVMPNRTITGSAAVRGVRPSKPLSQFAAASVSRGGRPVAERTLPPE